MPRRFLGLGSCLEIRVLEVALRLWSVQGAMGAKIRTVVNYMTQFGRHRGRLRVSKQLLR
ncbi:MAG: hypothetical protein BECKG1743D_GA0114223_100952 [Candidatus Kentron sp. G]|nr:MAG: hypothetical protein BECKG1743E_GA0114224_100901 [Candidatus Kentron sp. G]VFM98993.1 MAG: hypothetical protein BECKG1743D_GA0114223_100952 [Candidatus Kentron sp. G]